jgi:hypothetical protein
MKLYEEKAKDTFLTDPFESRYKELLYLSLKLKQQLLSTQNDLKVKIYLKNSYRVLN